MHDSAFPPPRHRRPRWRTLLRVALPVLLAQAPLWGVTPSQAAPAGGVTVTHVAAAATSVPAAVAAPGKARDPDEDDVPVYRTRLPPSTVVRYEISRGPFSGEGELAWTLQDGGYHLRLEGRVMGVRAIVQDSRGQVDAAGIAPVRFTDERRGKSARSANFQRAVGKITYAGLADEVRLVPGAQDRLSWMLQLGAIAEADPSQVASGRRVALFVTGARGDADVWTFRVTGTERLRVAGTAVSAVKLVREPRKPQDTQVEVWLDPAAHHLPVRARMTNDGETFELLRRPAGTS